MAKIKVLGTRCERCNKPMKSGEDYITEEISVTDHKWYHQKCVRKENIKAYAKGTYSFASTNKEKESE